MGAIKWAYTANWGEKAFSALFTFILAGLLGPREFGIASIAFIYISFLQMCLEQGLAAALVQRKDLECEHLDAAFWFNMCVGGVLVLLSLLLSRWWANLNHADGAAVIISILSLCIPLEGLSIVQRSLLVRDMDFKSLAIRSNVSVAISGALGLGLAFVGMGVWALVGQQLARDGISVILLWRRSAWRPRVTFSVRHIRELMGFSTANFFARLANFADGQLCSILLGVLFGPVAVGLYRLAERIVSCVVTMATSSIQSVALPEFSRLQDRPGELRESVLSCIRLSAMLTLPVLAGLAVVSSPLMASAGDKWIPATNALRVLCVAGMLSVFVFFTGPLMQALGKTRQIAGLEWARTGVGILSLLVVGSVFRQNSTSLQLMGIAFGRLIPSTLFVAPIFTAILLRLSAASFRDLLTSVGPAVLASGSIAAAVLLAQSSRVLGSSAPVIAAFSEAALGFVVGSTVLFCLDPHFRRGVGDTLRTMINWPIWIKG